MIGTQWLVHWPLMGGLLRLVQRGGDWAEPQPAQTPPRCTKCNSPTINGQCTNFILSDAFGVWRVKGVLPESVIVAGGVTDCWQHLLGQKDITICTIYFHCWLHENETSARETGDNDWNNNATCLSETMQRRTSMSWNSVFGQQSEELAGRFINIGWAGCGL